MTTTTLEIRREPGQAGCQRLASLCPRNPFYTHAYVQSRRRMGFEAFLLLERRGEKITSGCTAFLRTHWLTRSLEIPSLPTLSDSDVFWEALAEHCRSESIHYLHVNSYASTTAQIPERDGLRARERRYEYVIDLEGADLPELLSSNHRRNVDKAVDAGLELRRRDDPDAVTQHLQLIEESLRRRQSRGEEVPEDVPRKPFDHLIQTGSAVIFQACEAGEPLSSVLLLRSRRGAYYQSAGTGSRGRRCGASHFTLHGASVTLQREGLEALNLGGVEDPSSGLARYKAGFGAEKVDLASGTFYFGSPVHSGLEELKNTVRNLLFTFLGGSSLPFLG